MIIGERNFDPALRHAYYHALFGNHLNSPDDKGTGVSDGTTAGNLIVTLGGWPELTGDARIMAQAGTLMHELGHNLRLQHGGGDNTFEYTPNYLSVMSYNYQIVGLQIRGGSHKVDYAR